MPTVADVLAAIQARDPARAAQLVRDDPALARQPAPDGTSVLLQAAYARMGDVVGAILSENVEPDAHAAAALGLSDALRARVATDRGVLRRRSGDGWTPLHLAAHFGHRDACIALLNLGADPGAIGTNALRNTPLHAAAAGAHARVVELLVQVGAPLDAPDSGRHTPLHVAAATGCGDCVRVLLAAGADRDARDAKGLRPVDHARSRGHGALVDALG